MLTSQTPSVGPAGSWNDLPNATNPQSPQYYATGFLVEDGEFKFPVNEITIAGNFKEMFKNIILANDLDFEYSTNSPTMMIEGMVVAGK